MHDQGLKFASVPVSDQDRALEFYTRCRGFRVLTDQPFDDHQRWIELGLPGNGGSLVLFTPDEHRDRIGTYQHVTFYADDVRRTCEEMKRLGVEFVQEPQTADWGTAAIFKDQDGNVFVLSSKWLERKRNTENGLVMRTPCSGSSCEVTPTSHAGWKRRREK